MNPVDTKVRKGSLPPEGQAKVLGWDAVGTVEEALLEAAVLVIILLLLFLLLHR